MKKNDLDFIKEKFDNDGVKAPDSISEAAIAEKLPAKVKLYQKPAFKKAVSLVACFALLIGIMSFALPESLKDGSWEYSDNASNVKSYELKTVKSYEQLVAVANEIHQAEQDYGNAKFEVNYGSVDVDGSFAGSAESGVQSEGSSSYAETYKQVAGVDEGDIIKNDGKHIFYVNNDNEVLIYEGEKLVSKITDYVYLEDRFGYHYDNVHGSINELYICNNLLVLIDVSVDDDDRTASAEKTNVHIYDIEDIYNPKKIKTFSQSGNFPKTRMIGSQLYVISNVYTFESETAEDFRMFTEEDGIETEIPANSIQYCDGNTETNCLIIGTIDIDKIKRTADTKAFFGCGSTVYCNDKNLYIAIHNLFSDNQIGTGIIKAELDPKKIEFTEMTETKGFIHNQFSMDEKDGYLRVATTDENGNNLYVFDDNLQKVGEITGLAKGEAVKAARYIGNMCYLITYEQTDPLFVIDISNPREPIVKGSVEITGFSSQLHPVDENKIIGIGYSESFGIKLVLFDISNASEPKVLDTYELNGDYARSNAQNNHKAIVVNNDKDYIAIDYFNYLEENQKVESGVLLFNAKDNKINILNKKEIECVNKGENIERLTYIDNTIYALDSMGNIYSFDM